VHSREVKRKREEKLLEKNMNKWGQIIMEEKMVLPQVLQKSLMFKRHQNKLVNKLSMKKNLNLHSLPKLKRL
jgi:cobalamin-dependent methionine synthase I